MSGIQGQTHSLRETRALTHLDPFGGSAAGDAGVTLHCLQANESAQRLSGAKGLKRLMKERDAVTANTKGGQLSTSHLQHK